MTQFTRAVTEDPRSAARIFAVSGAAGAGKSRFVEEALVRLARSGHPIATVQPELVPGLDGAAFLRSLAVKLPLGGAMLSGAISRLVQGGPGVRLDDSSARALVNALFHENYDCGVERRGFIRPKFQRLALVLDDFGLVAAGIARWLAADFLPLLDEVRSHLDYMLILVGERGLADELEPVAWNAQPMRFVQITIPPMSEAESVELLALFARRTAEAKACHEIGEGLPGAMLELLGHRIRSLGELATTVERCNETQARALLTVAGLGLATEEGVRLALGSDGAATVAALLDAAVNVPVFGSPRTGLWLPGAVARVVFERLRHRHAETAQRAEAIAELLDTLAVHFPAAEDRARAARLAVFAHFDGEALRACFGAAEGAELERFARTHSGAYDTTAAENFRLTDELRAPLGRYAEACGDPAEAALRAKVAQLWSERSAELQVQLKNATAAFGRLERDRDALFKELEAARGQMTQTVQDKQKEWRLRIDDDIVRLGTSLLANGAGVACFWVALFTDSQRMTFLLLGAILIGVGIGTPAMARGRKAAAADQAAVVRRRQDERVGQARGMVSLLEARVSGMQERLAEERRKLERLSAAAEEPYL